MKKSMVIIMLMVLGYVGGGVEASGVKRYPLKVCLVTDNELGSMGKPYRIVHEGREIKFCCKPCVKKFGQNPELYLKKLN